MGGVASASSRFQLARAVLERLAPQIAIAVAEQVEEHNRCRHLLRQQLHARGRRMQAKLQRIEVEPAVPRDDDLAVQNAALGQCRAQRADSSGK